MSVPQLEWLLYSPPKYVSCRPPMQALQRSECRGLVRLARAFTSLPIIDVSSLLEHGVRLHYCELAL